MNTELFHNLTFYALYFALALAVFVFIERTLFYSLAARDGDVFLLSASGAKAMPEAPGRETVTSRVARRAARELQSCFGDAHVEEISEDIYIEARSRLKARLWLLDTIVTAAPLLGLLGTIFGIIDTFSALASSGISDPSGVSAGIGTALFATALGIGVAVIGLLFHNFLQERVEAVGDTVKLMLLRASAQRRGVSRPDATVPPVPVGSAVRLEATAA